MNCPNNHPFAIYLALNNIQHRHTCAQKPQINSLVERCHRTVLEEFRRAPAHHYEAVSELHTDIDACLVSYNRQRQLQGAVRCSSMDKNKTIFNCDSPARVTYTVLMQTTMQANSQYYGVSRRIR